MIITVLIQRRVNLDTKILSSCCFDVLLYVLNNVGLVTLLVCVQISFSQFLIKAACRV